MRVYYRAWYTFWSMVMVVGFVLAMLQWSAIGALTALAILYVLCRFVRHLLPFVVPGWHPLTSAIAFLTLVAFSRVSLALGPFLVLTAGLASPPVVRRAVRSARRSPKGHAIGQALAPTPEEPRADAGGVDSRLTLPETMGPLKGLDDRQLCRLWRESFWVLRQPLPPETVLCLVALREACLDELERRDAFALRVWLDSGARASGGPEKYLTHPPQREPGDGDD